MAFRTSLSHYLTVAARYLAKPRTLAMRRPYFLPQMYNVLDQPWLKAINIATILDIGAHVGGFAYTVRPLFPKAHIYAFEPLPACYVQLQEKQISNCTALNIALGDQSGNIIFQRYACTQSSSFLKPSKFFISEYPAACQTDPIEVQVARLDDIAQSYPMTEPLLIKIDVQGYEDHVLRGGEQTIRRSQVLIIETSFQAQYEVQPLFDTIYRLVARWGFSYAGAFDQLTTPSNGRICQQDSLFIREHSVAETTR